MFELRPYQEAAIERVREAIRAGHRRILVVIATAGGKTVTAGKIIRNIVERKKRAIFMAHRKELIQQCSDTLDEKLSVDHGVIKRNHPRRDRSKPVQVASIQTLIKRDHWEADLIVIDEAHRAAANTYVKLIERYDNPIVIGLSVGPHSFCEFRGGPFGAGWAGPIAEAYKRVSELQNKEERIGTFHAFRINDSGIESRGWNGAEFTWKKVKTFLRHKCDRPLSSLHVGGDRLVTTKDHSIYRVRPGERWPSGGLKKNQDLTIENVTASEVSVGDICLLDDGKNWDPSEEIPFDILSLKSAVQVRVDFSMVLSREDSGLTSRSYFNCKKSVFGERLTKEVFLRFEDRLPPARFVYSAGGNSVKSPRYITLSNWAYIFGFYLGDGWVDSKKVNFAVENGMVDDMLSAIEALVPRWNPKVRQMPGASCEIRCSNSIISELFSAVTGGAKAYEKFIPGEWIMSWSESARMELLNGMIDSDGHVSERARARKRVYYTTTSKRLARTLLLLLRSLGISGSIYKRPNALGGMINGHRIIGKRRVYSVHWSLNSMFNISDGHRGLRTRYQHGEMSFNEAPVRNQKKPRKVPKFVYDLEMDGHPSFVANGILVHNTATPYRQDGQPLGRKYDEHGNEVGFGFDAIVEVITTQELVDQGYLVNPIVFGCANPDMSRLKVGSKGDYSPSSASKAVEKTIMHGEIIANWAKICGEATGAETIWGEVPIDSNGDEIQGELFINDASGKTRRKVMHTNCDACTVAFLPTVEDSKRLAKQFNDAGVPAVHIDGNTSDKEREQVLNDLRDRKIYVVTNCELLTEGWDLPHLECIIGARLTRSLALFKQMGGRIMRPDDDKRFAYLLDHANWTRTHGFLTDPTEHSLKGREKRPRKGDADAPTKECPQCGSLHPLITRICEECGYEFPTRETVFTDEDLVELNGKKISSGSEVPLDTRQQAFNRYAVRCAEEKRNPKQAEYLYFKEFGEWPTRETGVVIPKFFWQYKGRFQKRKAQQAAAQKAANQV